MRTLSIILFFFFASCTYSQDTIRPYYGGNERLEEYPRDEKRNYLAIKSAWLPNGQQTIFEGNGYREYEMWGEIRRYYYRNGNSNGLVLFLDTTKTKIYQMGYFSGDIRDGAWITFHDNGQISSSVTYDSGKVISPMKIYYENASLKASYTVNDNLEIVGAYEEYYPSGKVKISGQYDFILCKSLLDSSEYKFQKQNNRIRPKPIPVGEWKEFYENGAIRKKYFYDNYCTFTAKREALGEHAWSTILLTNNCPEGEWISYDQNGKVISIEKYEDCILCGDKKKRKNKQ